MPLGPKIQAVLSGTLKEQNLGGTLEGITAGLFWVVALQLYFPLGLAASLVNFTYGAKGLDPAAKAQLPFLFLAWLGVIWGWEIFFRGFLLRHLLKKCSWPKAVLIHLFAVNLAVWIFLWDKAVKWETLGPIRFFLIENLFESFLALFFLRTGSLLAVTLLHAGVNFVRFVVISDVAGPFETFYFYSTASDLFYGLIAGIFFLPLIIQLCLNQGLGIREGGIKS